MGRERRDGLTRREAAAGGRALRRRRAPAAGAGALLQGWRRTRRLSQLALAHEAGVSPRHVSFLETGRARPSREMLHRLAETLGVPLRERNTLLVAAGFAPTYREADVSLLSSELGPVRAALAAILRQQEPYPAVVMDRHWDLLEANTAATRFFGFLLGGGAPAGRANILRLMLGPAGLRPFVANWEATAAALIRRVHREAVGGVVDESTRQLIDELYPPASASGLWPALPLEAPPLPVIPVEFAKEGRTFRYFSTVTTLGTPQDVQLQEIRIECFFPLDGATRRHARQLARDHRASHF